VGRMTGLGDANLGNTGDLASTNSVPSASGTSMGCATYQLWGIVGCGGLRLGLTHLVTCCALAATHVADGSDHREVE
jgi:hypothetical protein